MGTCAELGCVFPAAVERLCGHHARDVAWIDEAAARGVEALSLVDGVPALPTAAARLGYAADVLGRVDESVVDFVIVDVSEREKRRATRSARSPLERASLALRQREWHRSLHGVERERRLFAMRSGYAAMTAEKRAARIRQIADRKRARRRSDPAAEQEKARRYRKAWLSRKSPAEIEEIRRKRREEERERRRRALNQNK